MAMKNLEMSVIEQTAAVHKKSESAWPWLYKLGSLAAIFSALIIPISIIAYIAWPPAETVIGHFEQFQNNWIVGLLGMDLLYLLANVILIPTWLALYVALRRANESLMAAALTLGLIGTVALIAARPIVEMLALSQQYAAATTEAQQAIYLAAGEALLAIYHGTSFNIHYLLGTIALLIISFMMLNSQTFSKGTAYIGIAANIITLGYYLPIIGIYVSIFSVLFYWIWYLLIARRLWQLST